MGAPAAPPLGSRLRGNDDYVVLVFSPAMRAVEKV